MKFAVKVVSFCMASPADVLPIQQSNIYSLRLPYNKLGKASFPCVLRPCPCGVICSYWEHLAGFPKRSTNPFRLLLHSDMYQLIRHYFCKQSFQKSGSFLGTYLHYTTAGSCTSYDKKSFLEVMNFYLPLLISSWLRAIQK